MIYKCRKRGREPSRPLASALARRNRKSSNSRRILPHFTRFYLISRASIYKILTRFYQISQGGSCVWLKDARESLRAPLPPRTRFLPDFIRFLKEAAKEGGGALGSAGANQAVR